LTPETLNPEHSLILDAILNQFEEGVVALVQFVQKRAAEIAEVSSANTHDL
jgi:hypothetical protein